MRSFASLVFCLVATAATADSLTVLHGFNGADGQSPTGLVLGSDGKLYGVGANGGDQKTCDPDGCGVVFSLGLDGAFTKLHDFHTSDGYQPTGLVEGKHGTFYGTTFRGGAESGGGGGVLYSINAKGKFKVLHRFGDGFACCGPAMPTGHLVKAKDGKLYGSSMWGGDFRDLDHGAGFGTIYRFDPDTKQVTVLHSFNLGDESGIFPRGPLFLAKDGALYGTTSQNESGGNPSLFRIDTAGDFSVVTGLPAMEPIGGVMQARGGDFFGTNDGAGGGNGSLFRVTATGKLTVFNQFDRADGRGPHYQFTQGSNGFLYSTAEEGGLLDPQGGTIYRTDGKDDFRVLHSFASSVPNGILPNATLVQTSDGMLYGTAALGGAGARGTVYRLDPADLGPVASVTFESAKVKSGRKAKGTVTLFAPADHDTVVALGAEPGPVTVPATVTVKAGESTAAFTAKTFQIGAENDTRVYASVNGQGTRTVLKVTP